MLAIKTDNGAEYYLGATWPARWQGDDTGDRISLGNVRATVFRRPDGLLGARWTPLSAEGAVEARLYTPEQRAQALQAAEARL